jgi:hypothetical protein
MDEVMFPVSIVRYTSDHPPGWVVCEFRDIHGQFHISGHVKQVYVRDHHLDEATAYPVPGQTECVVMRTDGPVSTIRFTRLTWDGIDDDDHPFEVPTSLLPARPRPAAPSDAADGGV